MATSPTYRLAQINAADLIRLRKLAHGFWLFNLPLLLLGLLSIYGIPLVIPGFLLLRDYHRIAKGAYSIQRSCKVWRNTILFNSLLLLCFLSLIYLLNQGGAEMVYFSFICIPSMIGIGIGRIGLSRTSKHLPPLTNSHRV